MAWELQSELQWLTPWPLGHERVEFEFEKEMFFFSQFLASLGWGTGKCCCACISPLYHPRDHIVAAQWLDRCTFIQRAWV